MKQTEIDYIQQEGKVYITAIRNVASVEELEKEFGRDATQRYLRDVPVYRQHTFRSNVIVLSTKLEDTNEIRIGSAWTRHAFSLFVHDMKAAGDRLQQAKRDAAAKVKTVKI